jgi:hypothetical protein
VHPRPRLFSRGSSRPFAQPVVGKMILRTFRWRAAGWSYATAAGLGRGTPRRSNRLCRHCRLSPTISRSPHSFGVGQPNDDANPPCRRIGSVRRMPPAQLPWLARVRSRVQRAWQLSDPGGRCRGPEPSRGRLMAWKIRIDAVGSPGWIELRRQRDIARSWTLDIAPSRKNRKQATVRSGPTEQNLRRRGRRFRNSP